MRPFRKKHFVFLLDKNKWWWLYWLLKSSDVGWQNLEKKSKTPEEAWSVKRQQYIKCTRNEWRVWLVDGLLVNASNTCFWLAYFIDVQYEYLSNCLADHSMCADIQLPYRCVLLHRWDARQLCTTIDPWQWTQSKRGAQCVFDVTATAE